MVEAGVGLNIACPSLLPPLHPAGAHGGLSPYVLDRVINQLRAHLGAVFPEGWARRVPEGDP